MRYAVVIEKGLTSYGAYVPDLLGCGLGDGRGDRSWFACVAPEGTMA
jgi:hypothetical protein